MQFQQVLQRGLKVKKTPTVIFIVGLLIILLIIMSTVPESDFYVTILSDNTSNSEFSVRLPEQIRLDERDWSVGITEFSFVNSRPFLTIHEKKEGTILIDFNDKVFPIVLMNDSFSNIESIFKAINDAIYNGNGVEDHENLMNVAQTYEAAESFIEDVDEDLQAQATPSAKSTKPKKTTVQSSAQTQSTVHPETGPTDPVHSGETTETKESPAKSSNKQKALHILTSPSNKDDILDILTSEDPPTTKRSTDEVYIEVEWYPKRAKRSLPRVNNMFEFQVTSDDKVEIKPYNLAVRRLWLPPKIANVFGFNRTIRFSKKQRQSKKSSDHINTNSQEDVLFIHTNIIKPQIYNETKTKVLRTVPVETQVGVDRLHYAFDKVYYLPVEALSLNTLDIRITNNRGDVVHLDQGPTMLVLRFI